MNKVVEKIDQLRSRRGWSVYKLSQESGVPAPTIQKWFQTELYPSIPVLMRICDGFKITLAEFFIEGELVELTGERKHLFDYWSKLNKNQQTAVETILKSYVEDVK